jgi:hypothetical protein
MHDKLNSACDLVSRREAGGCSARPPRRRPTADDLSDLEVEVEVTQVWYAVQVTALTDHGSYGPRFLFVVVTEQRGGAAPAGPGALYGVRGDDRPPRTSAPIAGA